MKRKLFVFVLLTVLAFTACDISLSDTPVLDNVENTLPYITYVDSGTVIGGVQSTILVEPENLPVKEGFILSGWAYDAEGTRPVTAWNTTITESVTIYAIWTVDTSSGFVFVSSENGNDENGDGSKDAPYKTIAKALENSEKVFIEGTFAEDIKISADNAVIISGLESPVVADSYGRAVVAEGDAASLIKGTITLADGAVLTLRNLAIAPESAGAYAISADDGVSVNLDNVYINTSSGGRGISVVDDADTEEPIDNPVDVNLKFTTISLNGAGSRGINIDGSHDQTQSGVEKVSISMSDSTIIQSEDDESSVYPVQIFRSELAELEMNNVFIYIAKNYYAFRFFDVGSNDGPVSTITIKDSYLKAWSAFYVQANTQNVKAEVVNSTLTGVGKNSGPTDDFATISIDSSSNVKLHVVESEIIFNKAAEADQQAAAIYYFDNKDPYTGGNRISFGNCDFRLEGKNATSPGVMAYADNITGKSTKKLETGNEEFVYEEQTTAERNEIVFDAASLASLIRQGYVHENKTEEIEIWLHVPASEDQNRPRDGYAYRFDEDIYMFAYEDGIEKGFAGGAGTQEHPYLISDANQLKAVENQIGYYYYELTNDIVMEGNFNVNSFSGVLDGNGHSLILKEADTRHPSIEECGLILEVSDAVFKDLDYYMTGIKSLVLFVNGETTFQNVDVYGDITLIDNNVAGYMVYADDADEYDIVFDSCTSYANYDDPEGTHYGAHFVAYYPLNTNVKFFFTDCSVEGQFFSGRSGVLFGNSSQIASWGKNVGVKNLIINGEITSIQYNYPAGIISWGNVSEYDNMLKESTQGVENLKTLGDNIELTNAGGKIKFSAKDSSSEDIARFKISGLSNIFYVNGIEGSYETSMHRTWTFTLAEVEDSSSELDFSNYVVVDASYAQLPEGQESFASFTNSDGEICYYIENNEPDYEYAYFGSPSPTGAFTKDDDGKVKFGHFAVSAYDAAGNLIGYKSIANN